MILNLVTKISEILDQEFPEEQEIKSVDEALEIHERLIDCSNKLKDFGIFTMPHYRGEQNYGWDILPGIFRPPFYSGFDQASGKKIEEKAIELFEEEILKKIGPKALIDSTNKPDNHKKWNLLMQAQHAGIKTNLTDWSPWILSAMFFATEFDENFENENAQLWAILIPIAWVLPYKSEYNDPSFYEYNPFQIGHHFIANPAALLDNIDNRVFEYRYFKQDGRFLAVANETCNTPINKIPILENLLKRFIIPSKYKLSIRKELNEMNINRKKFFIEESQKAQEIVESVNHKLTELS